MYMFKRPSSVALLSLLQGLGLALVSGCSDDEPSAGELLAVPVDCGGREHTPCDVLDAGCQARLAEIAACQWGGPGSAPVVPPIAIVTEEAAREQIAALVTPDAMQVDGMTQVTDAAAARAALDDVLVLFGLTRPSELTPESSIERQATTSLAFYEFAANTITIIDRGGQEDPAVANVVLLHELVHAQQDAAHDLITLQVGKVVSTDSSVAFRSLVEGEADFHARLFAYAMASRTMSPESLSAAIAADRARLDTQLSEDMSSLLDWSLSMPYVYGPSWVLQAWSRGGAAALHERYLDLPKDSLEILRAAWGEKDNDDPVTPFPGTNVFYRVGQEPAADSEVLPLGIDRLGAWTIYVASRLHASEAQARDLALDWRGDQIDVFELDAGGSAGRWRMTFRSPDAARAFADLLSTNPDVTTRVSGSTLVAVVSASGVTPEWLFGPLGAL
jgi:hypothetical protein